MKRVGNPLRAKCKAKGGIQKSAVVSQDKHRRYYSADENTLQTPKITSREKSAGTASGGVGSTRLGLNVTDRTFGEQRAGSGGALLDGTIKYGTNKRAKLQEDGDYNSPSIQEKILQQQAQDCKNGSITLPGWCSTTWDGILCWPSTAPSNTAVQTCPHYIAGFVLQANASRHCMPNGQWYWDRVLNSTWTNYTRCFPPHQMVTVLMDLGQDNNVSYIEGYLPKIKYISKVGYAVSFSTLVVAFCILASIKKLRCQRNILHMHLFASFIVRAFAFLLKDVLFVNGVGLNGDVLTKNGESYWQGDDKLDSNWHCKAFVSLWQYCILANYSWILMEGLYLHNLIFCALFAENNASITVYVILGWGLPANCVTMWVVLRVLYEDVFCWTMNENTFIFQFIRLPTTLSVIINFILFVNIVRVLLSKLKSTVTEESMRYKRLARSTLVLVPLFGVHYFVLLGMSYSMGVNETVEIVWLFCDQLFASFQGFFVAVLYCFLNGEVRTEVTRAIRSRKLPRLARGFAFRLGNTRPSTHSGSTCSCNTAAAGGGCTKQQHPQPPAGYESLEKLCGHCCCWPCCRQLLVHARHHRSTHSMASTQDIGIGTRGGSLASSRGYLEVVGGPGGGSPGSCGDSAGQQPNPLQMSTISIAACQAAGPAGIAGGTESICKNMEQSILSFYSHLSEVDRCISVQAISSVDNKCVVDGEETSRSVVAGDEHAWSDSECCHLAYELHHLHATEDP